MLSHFYPNRCGLWGHYRKTQLSSSLGARNQRFGHLGQPKGWGAWGNLKVAVREGNLKVGVREGQPKG